MAPLKRESFEFSPSLARRSGVVVDFEHPKDGHDAKARFRIFRFREIKVRSMKRNLAWDRGGGLAMRGHLAHSRVESLRKLVLMRELLFGLPIGGSA